ncbi:NYN domain-containing protein [Mesorhizobium sp.]|uniref:NYN domain-containing protein n=1 Tax=Mesorhizobium sp. TaxID=1871066 RepID=UPI000FE627FC|nr:NYN domain-containing protein [Mesorhizobium sp.]RWG07547.1 MAG: NYN domain-containing protein [Mesorhizobium sp.]RWG93654.1 MAG: NYN domain-containing protein [Mesorhizobium sp.]TIR92250.1 MAG: NYN domain-containing protein [Mesorhizobium sp.]
MSRCAVFVDAGYLFAQGSTALTGSKKARTALSLDAKLVVECLKEAVTERAPDAKLLRIYWYDGATSGSRPTTDQAAVASLDDVKLRLGFINSHGQQKGVDSLIVTDMIELARLKSISDAVLLSGDEDVRVGVQIAQNYGVRVHLLGIAPSRGSQSQQLMQEADTTTEWGAETIKKFISVREEKEEVIKVAAAKTAYASVPAAGGAEGFATIETSVIAFVEGLGKTDLDGIVAYWKTDRGVPSEMDRKLLPICGAAIGGKLSPEEIRHMRATFQKIVKAKIAAV